MLNEPVFSFSHINIRACVKGDERAGMVEMR